MEICEICKKISKDLKDNGIPYNTLLAVDYFFWSEILPLAEKKDNAAHTVTQNQPKVGKKASKSIHDEIKNKLVEIGAILGFESKAEVKIATGAVVDVVWEAKIGNMGKSIYVFEVQTSGSIDSLLINLQRAKNNKAVQSVVAVSDAEQIEKIKNENSTLRPDL